MLVLLPPSEGKAEPQRTGRRRVDLSTLAHPELTEARRAVLDAVVGASARDDAADRFGVGPAALAEVRRNVDLARLPARPAHEVYTGVLYAALDHPSLSADARRRAARWVRVQSALWGPIRLGDVIPSYRVSAHTRLPGFGSLPGWWRERTASLDLPAGPVVDCRSQGYADAWRMPAGVETLQVRVVTEVDGRLVSVSHHAKHTRGLVVRALLETDRPLRSGRQVVAALGAAGFDCALLGDGPRRRLEVRAVLGGNEGSDRREAAG
ncbi:hypothetical protein FHX74_001139 [Friedmanniella endophytica]|uniref:Peroxide stress protein YaaA n=1 Tax=Microlunatus kandeliicorticis TaxID=1759536 RepID=A0A7W3IQS4_9ACTN|nr:peroxide stress protein YaaA [Microlunatus kandeliicorticis]MBA8793534.1 hypothetical protein [Microlunatus kandeliicorticis]